MPAPRGSRTAGRGRSGRKPVRRTLAPRARVRAAATSWRPLLPFTQWAGWPASARAEVTDFASLGAPMARNGATSSIKSPRGALGCDWGVGCVWPPPSKRRVAWCPTTWRKCPPRLRPPRPRHRRRSTRAQESWASADSAADVSKASAQRCRPRRPPKQHGARVHPTSPSPKSGQESWASADADAEVRKAFAQRWSFQRGQPTQRHRVAPLEERRHECETTVLPTTTSERMPAVAADASAPPHKVPCVPSPTLNHSPPNQRFPRDRFSEVPHGRGEEPWGVGGGKVRALGRKPPLKMVGPGRMQTASIAKRCKRVRADRDAN